MHNLVGGTVRLVPVHDRATPYHRPYSTQVAGYAVIYGGYDRWIGNVFLGGDIARAYGYDTTQGTQPAAGYGTAAYDGSPTSLEDYVYRIAGLPEGNYGRIPGVREPAYLRDNVYAAGARAFAGESAALALAGEVSFEVVEEGDGTPVVARADLVGQRKKRGQDYPAGPIATLAAGQSRIRVW